jgi:tetratricopeptide (TPR) repeat protein
MLALLALVGLVLAGAVVWLSGPWSASPVEQQIRAAAGERPVNKTDRLIWSYQEAVRENPDDLDAHAILGDAYIQKARETGDPTLYGKAEAVLDTALKRDPQHVESMIGKGQLLLAQHNFREGLAIGQRAQAINPTIPRIYGVIADAQIELGLYDDALQTVQTMVDKRPDLSSYSRVSYVRELYGDLDGAIEAMAMAVRAGGPTSENTEWTRVQLGNLYFARGDLASAELQYQTSLQRLPEYVHALAGLGKVRAVQGRTAEAIDLLQQAIARMPLAEFVIMLGEIHEAAGQTEAAARQYELVRAMQQLFKANGVDTDLELALFDADRGHDPQATVAMARVAYERRPGIKASDTLAWALFKAGRLDEASRYASEALRLGTKDALMLYHAGMIASAHSNRNAARTYLRQALELNPHFSPLHAPRARATLAELDR